MSSLFATVIAVPPFDSTSVLPSLILQMKTTPKTPPTSTNRPTKPPTMKNTVLSLGMVLLLEIMVVTAADSVEVSTEARWDVDSVGDGGAGFVDDISVRKFVGAIANVHNADKPAVSVVIENVD